MGAMWVRHLLMRLLPEVRFALVRDESDLSDAEWAEQEADRALRATLENVYASEADGPYSCPCCGHKTLPSRGNYDLCSECNWEDDGQDDHDSAVVRPGPNGAISLDTAREDYRAVGGQPQEHGAPSRPRKP